ncbi:hypothetical protein Taro_052392 [Colocasia esculenta]|uniref:Targeting protein for Xklp2 n=1 Tax=Colocasia esculenta TaxID=4460 RepID=A0A843XIB6_COLES|nr:hypothetical protein [Colocasia esculenta]
MSFCAYVFGQVGVWIHTDIWTSTFDRCSNTTAARKAPSTDIAQENQAIKRQKLDGGRCHQIHNVKNRVLMHKSKPGLTSSRDFFASATKGRREEIKKKFQSKTREIEISQNRSHEDAQSIIQRRPKVLTLTRPKEPELTTGHRVRAVRIKNSEELEAEMLAKIPKFKARPVNKKILDAPRLPAPQRSTPQPPAFQKCCCERNFNCQEFHFKTMERASRNAGTSSSVVSSSIDSSTQDQAKLHRLTEPRPPLLETSLRARPPKVKSSEEMELEELEKIPKFKARPLNKKILESRGDLGLYCNSKRQITIPQEFHFATDERMGPSASSSVVDLFDKERGLDKGTQFTLQLVQKEIEEERARIPKANPYPYTTDYPVIPPKPAPKECTKPEAFQLESLVRHEEAMQRKMEEKERMEKEEAQRRLFRAQPVLNVDPFPVAKKERKPLTEVQGLELHVDHRATERAEFDRKVKEKETVYKRLRDEYEATKMIEEEKAVKQMRKTMVSHARPLPNFDNPFLPHK